MKSFERQVINPILTCIKNNQVYLTQPENLPQLAKLGYMYNTLWYAGRICWGSSGIIKRQGRWGQCEDNPKYKIEMCEPETDEIDSLIYDAWGMHVGYSDKTQSWKEFSTIVLKGKELTEWEKKFRKTEKTFDEWVEVLTDYEYDYTYDSRRDVASQLLCTIGNGYGYKDGYIIQEASGADEDISLYGEWENAKFRKDIQSLVNRIMSYPEVEQTVETAYQYIFNIVKKKEDKEDEFWIKHYGMTYKQLRKSPKYKEIFNERPDKYIQYYPIAKGFSEITKFDKNTHPSYLNAAKEVCEDILLHESEERPENVKFAKQFLKKQL